MFYHKDIVIQPFCVFLLLFLLTKVAASAHNLFYNIENVNRKDLVQGFNISDSSIKILNRIRNILFKNRRLVVPKVLLFLDASRSILRWWRFHQKVLANSGAQTVFLFNDFVNKNLFYLNRKRFFMFWNWKMFFRFSAFLAKHKKHIWLKANLYEFLCVSSSFSRQNCETLKEFSCFPSTVWCSVEEPKAAKKVRKKHRNKCFIIKIMMPWFYCI